MSVGGSGIPESEDGRVVPPAPSAARRATDGLQERQDLSEMRAAATTAE